MFGGSRLEQVRLHQGCSTLRPPSGSRGPVEGMTGVRTSGPEASRLALASRATRTGTSARGIVRAIQDANVGPHIKTARAPDVPRQPFATRSGANRLYAVVMRHIHVHLGTSFGHKQPGPGDV